MRVLLIDNHDSFSAILRNLLWELTGEQPLFFRNDALTREELQALSFDAAVLSPGPGHPARVRDFGVCLDLLQLYPDLPVLGVCLGHQGLAHFAGGRVVPVPGALHGRPGRIRHDGEGIFRGLPPDFEAIRYHSLAVEAESLPGNVQVTAVSVEDGRVMGLAFRDRPWHGVQFHPESIGTPPGAALLGNFLDLAAPSRPAPAARVAGSGRTRAAAPPASPVPFLELSWRDPAEIFSAFFPEASGTFWLDGERPPASSASGWPATVMGKAGALFEFRGLASFREWVAGLDLDGDRAAPWTGYRGGPVGHLAYELYRDTLGINPPRASNPDSGEPLTRWMLPEGYLVFDHAARKTFAAWEGREPPPWLRDVLGAWNAPPSSALAGASALPPFSEWEPLLGEAEYKARVHALQDSIARGDTYEACLTHAFSARSAADARAVFLRLRARNPAPYAAWLAFPDVRILSVSPELFLEMSPAGVLRGRPIKGTRPRGKTGAEDDALRADLRDSVKDGAENRMIVDLTRHDFSRVCAPGSVEVPSFLEVETHPAVFQMVSEVRGTLAAGMTSLDAVEACFPGGSMTGAPKERTVELLAKLEAGPRGVYSGALGWFTRGGALTLSMVIRTLENRGDRWRVGCGGAVLADSNPDAEWREAVLKARSVIDASAR
jgi:para-aminobenzoate synthetase